MISRTLLRYNIFASRSLQNWRSSSSISFIPHLSSSYECFKSFRRANWHFIFFQCLRSCHCHWTVKDPQEFLFFFTQKEKYRRNFATHHFFLKRGLAASRGTVFHPYGGHFPLKTVIRIQLYRDFVSVWKKKLGRRLTPPRNACRRGLNGSQPQPAPAPAPAGLITLPFLVLPRGACLTLKQTLMEDPCC
jgi:hypothetical protein